MGRVPFVRFGGRLRGVAGLERAAARGHLGDLDGESVVDVVEDGIGIMRRPVWWRGAVECQREHRRDADERDCKHVKESFDQWTIS